MSRAIRTIGRRWRISPSALLIAAATLLLSRYTGHREIATHMLAGNRFDSVRRELIGTVSGQGLYYVDLENMPFSRISRSVFRASGQAHRFGFCDPDAVVALLEDLRFSHGEYIDLGTYINDLIAYDDTDEPEAAEEELRALTRATALRDGGGMSASPVKLDIRVHLTFQHGQVMPLLLACDTVYMPSDVMRQFLQGMERVLVAAACGEDDAAALGEISGVTPVRRGASWLRRGKGWVDVEASQRLLQEVNGAGQTIVLAERSDDDLRLVGYVANPDRPDLARLHRRCVAALGRRNDIRAPDWYKWIGPRSEHIDDHGSWQRAPVLSEGTGRRSA